MRLSRRVCSPQAIVAIPRSVSQMNGSETENNFSRAQLPVSASQPTRTQAAHARPNGNPRPYYSVVGRRYLEDLFELMAVYLDSLKFAGGSFSLMPEAAVRNLIELCHHHNVWCPPADFSSTCLPREATLCCSTLLNVKGLGLISLRSQPDSFLSQPMTDCGLSNWCRNLDRNRRRLMFEATDPDVFAQYIKNYGADVNLFVDHSQIVQLECLRAGIWGTKSLWGRVMMYKESRSTNDE